MDSVTLAQVSLLLRFLQGLSFFVLGMAIFFAAPRAERPEVIRKLPFLGVFAFCQALVGWHDVFTRALTLPFPHLLEVALLGIGYGFLLAFGLLAPQPSNRRLRARVVLLSIAVSIWPISMGIAWWAGLPGASVAFWGEIVARYGLALPGGLLAMWSMRRRYYHSFEPHLLQKVAFSRRTAGIALGAFGLLAGLIMPTALLLTAQDSSTISDTLFPVVSFLLILCGIASTYGLTRTLKVIQWEIERWIEETEQKQALAFDRERIGRELHDGIIQSIYAAGLMLEGAQQSILEDPTTAQAQVSRAMRNLNQTIQDIRRYIFDLRGSMPEGSLSSGLEELLRDFRVNTLLETELSVDGEAARPLSVEQRRHLFQIARETLSNVARHAHARQVTVRLHYRPDTLQLIIADDGIGLSRLPPVSGQGLRNVQERARLLEGTLDIDSAPGKGVTVTLTIPYSRREAATAGTADQGGPP